MLPISVPSKVQAILNQVTPNFKQNFKEDFMDEGARIRKKHEKHNLAYVLINDGSKNIDISNLAFKTPLFGLHEFEINLGMLNIYIEANLGQLLIEGDLKQTSIGTSVTESGKVVFTLDDVKFCGNIGLYIDDDSFMARCFDLDIKPSRIFTKISINDGAPPVENSDVYVEKSMLKHIWPQVLNAFETDILYSMVSAKICEYSVSELLLDEPDEMRAISATREETVGKFLDPLLNIMNEYFSVTQQTTLKTPSLNISIPSGNSSDGKLLCSHGEIIGLAFRRVGEMSVYESQGVQYIYGKIRIKDFKFKYVSCNAALGKLTSNDGTIEVSAYRNEIFLKLAIRKIDGADTICVDKVQAVRLMDIDFHMSKLQCLRSLHDQVETSVLGSIRGIVFPALEQKIEEGLMYAIQNRGM